MSFYLITSINIITFLYLLETYGKSFPNYLFVLFANTTGISFRRPLVRAFKLPAAKRKQADENTGLPAPSVDTGTNYNPAY